MTRMTYGNSVAPLSLLSQSSFSTRGSARRPRPKLLTRRLGRRGSVRVSRRRRARMPRRGDGAGRDQDEPRAVGAVVGVPVLPTLS